LYSAGPARTSTGRAAAPWQNAWVEPTPAWVISVNVAHIRTFEWRGRVVETGIYKEPVAGPVAVGRLGLAGDLQADLRVHGGERKAVYIYPGEHYAFWQREFPDRVLEPGVFGENLTTSGLVEENVREGDRLMIGAAIFEVTTPRLPCYKLAHKFGELEMIRRFAAAGRSGFYLAVVQPGTVEAGMAIELSPGESRGETIADVFRART
jgi:MOSC domain-containing protein YiiM